jgi:ElaB/YqjD/DUF883 family membrane-anchored ribosome-binding protein
VTSIGCIEIVKPITPMVNGVGPKIGTCSRPEPQRPATGIAKQMRMLAWWRRGRKRVRIAENRTGEALMSQLDTNRMRRDLRGIVDDVEQLAQSVAGNTGEQVDELKSRASRQLRNVGSRLAELEHGALDRTRAAGRHTRDYARSHPWVVVGCVAATVIAIAALGRARH